MYNSVFLCTFSSCLSNDDRSIGRVLFAFNSIIYPPWIFGMHNVLGNRNGFNGLFCCCDGNSTIGLVLFSTLSFCLAPIRKSVLYFHSIVVDFQLLANGMERNIVGVSL